MRKSLFRGKDLNSNKFVKGDNIVELKKDRAKMGDVVTRCKICGDEIWADERTGLCDDCKKDLYR